MKVNAVVASSWPTNSLKMKHARSKIPRNKRNLLVSFLWTNLFIFLYRDGRFCILEGCLCPRLWTGFLLL